MPQSTVKYEPQVHVWGIIGPNGTDPLKLLKRTLNFSKCQDVILKQPDNVDVCNVLVFPEDRDIFQQEKVPCHWSLNIKISVGFKSPIFVLGLEIHLTVL